MNVLLRNFLLAALVAASPFACHAEPSAPPAATTEAVSLAEVDPGLSCDDLRALGFVDVTGPDFAADPSGSNDCTIALQKAIDFARDNGMACFFPPGVYTISDTLVCELKEKNKPCILIGSTLDPERRAVLHLAPGSPGFDAVTNRKLIVYFTKDNGKGGEANTTHYDQTFRSIDLVVGEGNDGAAALRMQGAEGCTIQDVTIDLRKGGHTGIWGTPGSGGSAHQITILGGAIGLDTRNYPAADGSGAQPTPTVTGLTLINQTDKAACIRVRGAFVGVGWHIQTEQTAPIIWLSRNWFGEPFDSCFGLADSIIEYSTPSTNNTVFEMADAFSRSFYLDNCYFRNAAKVWSDDAPGVSNGWLHATHLGVHVKPQPVKVLGELRNVDEHIRVDAKPHGDVLFRFDTNAPPVNLLSQHGWGDALPSFEQPGIANAKDYGAKGDGETDDSSALKTALASNATVFLPKGVYRLSDTLELGPTSKLFGIHHLVSQIIAIENTTQRFGANPDPDTIAIPMIRTVNRADAAPVLAFLGVRMAFPIKEHDASTIGHYTLEWRAGRNSIVNMVDIHPQRNAGYYPQWVAKKMGIEEKPDCRYPEDDVPDHLIFCTTNSLIQIRGNGGGKWYNTWLHGNHMFREACREVLVDGTHEPLHFYHLHLQQQESDYHFEARNALNVNVYGIKCELKAGIAKFQNCAHVRLIGSGGLGTPDKDHGYETMFLFKDCADFVIACIGDDINTGKDKWIGACYYRWVNATLGTYHAIIIESGTSRFAINPFSRPIVYLQGTP